MLKIPGETNGAFCDGVSRRNFLQIGSLAMGGIALPELLRAEEALGSKAQKQKSIIMIFLPGGPPHQDMYDLKMEAPREIRGEFKPIRTSVLCGSCGELTWLDGKRPSRFTCAECDTELWNHPDEEE